MFFFSSFLAKEKKNQKEKTRFLRIRGVSLVATSDKGYAPLTGAHCRGGLAGVSANTPSNINLPLPLKTNQEIHKWYINTN